MILFIASLLTKFFHVDLQKAQRAVVIAFIVLGLMLVLIFGLWMKSCFTKTPKLTPQETVKAQQAIAKEDRKEMIEVLAASDTAEQRVDSNIKLAEEATEQAKKNYTNLSNDELAAELERRSKE